MPQERAEVERDRGVAVCRDGVEGARIALPLLEAALAARPDDVMAWDCKGLALRGLGRYDEALAAIREALNREPGREYSLAEAASVASAADRRQDAAAYWQRAIALSPWRSDYRAELAFVYFHTGDWQASADACRQSLRLCASSVKVRKLLVQCYLNLGDETACAASSRRSLASIRPTGLSCSAHLPRRPNPATESRDRGEVQLGAFNHTLPQPLRLNSAMRRRLVILSAGIGLALAGWLGVRAVEARRFREDLARARDEFGARRLAAARLRLARLAERRPGDGDVELLLGECERMLRHHDAALAAWGRIPEGAEQAPSAALSSGRLALALGRYRPGEACLLRARRAGGDIAEGACRLLEWLYWMTGRRDEQRAILCARAERAAEPSETLRMLWRVERDPYPVESITAALEKARQSAPGDDLVWLASADLAIRTRRFDEAGAWLDRCERARPDDPAVWRARVEWAKGAGRPDEVRRAVAHLPASGVPRAAMLAARAWLADRDGDRTAERVGPRGDPRAGAGECCRLRATRRPRRRGRRAGEGRRAAPPEGGDGCGLRSLQAVDQLARDGAACR